MARNIRVLDCTLRDGGYVNNWQFGRECILCVKEAIEKTGVDFLEMGMIQDVAYDENRTIFDNPQRIMELVRTHSDSSVLVNDRIIYGGLIEMSNSFPQERLPQRGEGDLLVLRYSFWKRLKDDAYQYAKQITEKGYKVCLQPTRAEQYEDSEFAELCKRMSELNPYGLYIVDTFGLLSDKDVIHYAEIANDNLAPDVVLGYHAHDNMGQAFCNACAFVEHDYGNRVVQIDASAFGIGRGAGNLKLEQILEYLIREHNCTYDYKPIFDIWDRFLSFLKDRFPWGNDLAYFVTALHHCNPSYATYYLNRGLSISIINKIICGLTGVDKYLYDDDKAEAFIKQLVSE